MNSFAQGIPLQPPPHASGRFEPVPTQTVATWPVGTFLENLLVLDEHMALVSVVSSSAVERVSLHDGRQSLFASFPREPTGMARLEDRVFFNVGSPGEHGWAIWQSDLDGGSSELMELPEALFLNGLTPFGSSQLLAVDSILGEVFVIDTDRGTARSWLRHELLTKNSPEPMLPGVNGIKVMGEHAYLTSTERALVLRCRVENGAARDLEVLAERFVGDDFAVDREGNLFITTHVHNQVQMLTPTGERTVLAGPERSLHGSTSCAFEASGDLLVTTTGGILAPFDGRVRPAQLLRLELGRSRSRFGPTERSSADRRDDRKKGAAS